MIYSPTFLLSIALTGNYSGAMLNPYFSSQLPNSEEGQLNKRNSFFNAEIKLTYNIKLTDAIKIQVSGGLKNILNSYQSDFDSGIDRDPAYVYGPLSPRTIYLGLKIGNL